MLILKKLFSLGIKSFLLFFSLMMFIPLGWASFEVIDEPPVDDRYVSGGYGNAQNQSFTRAINNEEPLDAEDMSYLSSVDGQRVFSRWYFKALLGRPSAKVKDVTNNTPGVTASNQPSKRQQSDDVFHLALGFGHKWKRFAAELELIISEAMKYDTNPMLSGGTISMAADIKYFALFANLEYEVPRFFDFITPKLHPYLNIGVGLAQKAVEVTSLTLLGQPRQKVSTNNTDLAWNIGVGLKYQLTGPLLIEAAWRVMQFGEVEFGPIEGIALKAKEINTSGIYFGITYQI